MDRIDIHMQVLHVEYQKLRDMRQGQSSAQVRARVEAARQHQRNRFAGMDIASNADMRPAPTGIIAGLGLTLCALIFFLHPKGQTPKSADRQP